jgi:hypothetical protein
VQAWGRGRDVVLGEVLLKVRVRVIASLMAIDVGSHRAVGEANRPHVALDLVLFLIR